MIRSSFRWVVRSAVVAGAVAFVLKLLRRDERASEPVEASGATVPRPSPATPPAAAPPATEATAPPWVAPEGGACPASHPIKVKESSGIFHVPEGLAYERTVPDRCYTDPAAAEADGYRQAKR